MYDIRKYALVSDQIDYNELTIVLNELRAVLLRGVVGSIVEFGCYTGTTSLFIQRLLAQQQKQACQFHVYDSFAGLPPKTAQDTSPMGEQFTAGTLHAKKADFIKNFKRAGLPIPNIHKSWFSELTTGDIPEQICFAFLDGDFYDSIKQSLQLIEQRVTAGATIIVDDYQSESLPGVTRAVDEWLQNKNYAFRHQSSLAVICT